MAEKNIQAACTSCGSQYKVPEKLIGKTVTCKKCSNKFVISRADNETMKIPVIGKLAVQYKFLSSQDLTKIIPAFNKSEFGKSENDFIKFLIKKNIVSRANMNVLVGAKTALETRRLDKTFASIVLENGFSDKEKIEKAIKKQTTQFQKTGDCSTLGDILVRDGAISEQQKKMIFTRQNRKVFSIKPENKEISDPDHKESVAGEINITEEQVNQFLKEYSNLPFPVTVKDIANVFSKQNLSLTLGAVLKKEGLISPPKKAPEKKEVETAKIAQDEKKEPETEDDEEVINVDEGVVDIETEDVEDQEPENPPTIIESDFMDIIISPDNIEVHVRFKKSVPKTMNVDTLKDLLIQNEISYGHVDDSLIYGYLNDDDILKKSFLVAEGVAPLYGKEGQLTFYFDTDPVKVGALDDSGHIDFKDRGEIPHCEEGELLADIVPSVRGVHGVDIYSNPVLVPEIPEVNLRCESGVTLSKDGRQAFASTSGQPLLIGGRRLIILQELNINGDVGYKTGHVDFDGNINISGTVQSGFKVKGTNVTALEILGAEIEAAGNIHVIAGVSGATIRGKGDLKAKYINKSDVITSGNIDIEKEIIDSNVESGGLCLLTRGKIISSSVSARKGLECKDIGTEMSSPCKIKIGGNEILKKDLADVDKRIKSKKLEIDIVTKKIGELQEKEEDTHVVIAELAHIQDRSQIEIREVEELEASDGITQEKIDEKEELLKRVKEADEKINKSFSEQEMFISLIEDESEKIEEITESLETLHLEKEDLLTTAKKFKKTPFAKISGVLYAGSHVRGEYANVVVRETIRRTKIYESQTKDPMASTAYEMKQMKL